MGDHKITVRLSDDAHRGLERAAQDSGVSFTAMIEAWGRMLAENPRLRPDVAAKAREIDAERRRRR